jgi:uncharacterized protein YjbJ (UPF0337 family)
MTMGSASDKAAGMGNEAMGKIKQGVGKVTGDDEMRADGAGQELKGKGQQALGDAKEGIKDAANKGADALNRKL